MSHFRRALADFSLVQYGVSDPFGSMWGIAFLLLIVEFLFSYIRKGADIKVIQNGQSKSLQEVVTDLIRGSLLDRANDLSHSPDGRFSSSVNELITGKPVEAALGVSHYMRVPKNFTMPSVADGVAAIQREVAEHGTPVDQECLNYILTMRAGSSDVVFANGNLKRDCDADGNVFASRLNEQGLGMLFSDFVRHPNSVAAALEAPHVLALRLYTTAAYMSLNNPLRDTSPYRPPHGFPVTISFLKQGISQLRVRCRPVLDPRPCWLCPADPEDKTRHRPSKLARVTSDQSISGVACVTSARARPSARRGAPRCARKPPRTRRCVA